MSLETHWCYACKHHSKDIPENYKLVAESLKEYKHIIYCPIRECLVVANENMWMDKTVECIDFKRGD